LARNRKRAKERRARRPQPVGTRRPAARPGPGDQPESLERAEQLERDERPESLEQDERAERLERDERPEALGPDERSEGVEEEVVPGPTAAHPDELAPNPIEHAAPDVELADTQLALGRVQPGVDGDTAAEEEFQREEKLVEVELAEQAEERREAVPVAPGERPNLFPRLAGFLQGSWRELQRVQWPDRRQVAQATGVVIGFVIVAGLFLGLSDLVAQKLVNYILK
jgi:preprotein translocase subunit SecE